MADEQEDHLKAHIQYFDGLLSIIPASIYYEQDRSDQWQRTKQTKEQARAAKRAKLDPMNAKSVKDVMDENDPGRNQPQDTSDVSIDGVILERPKEGMKPRKAKPLKPANDARSNGQLVDANESTEATAVQKLKAEKAERKEAKKERKRLAQAAKRDEKKKRLDEKLKRKAAAAAGQSITEPVESPKAGEDESVLESSEFGGFSEGNKDASAAISNTSDASKDDSPIFDAAALQSGASSISSFPEPGINLTEKTEGDPSPPKPTQDELKLRLQKRLAELRAARKADKDGAPALTRQQLLERRREKEAQRKAHKKALRKEAKEEERRKREEEIARGSPLMSPAIKSPAGQHGQSPLGAVANNFSFGRIAFDNGQTLAPGLDSVLDPQKKKAPHHAKLALQAAQRRTEKLDALDPEERAEAESKDMWNTAKKRAHGERVRDDTSLLKKTLKRKEKQKKKSEKEWNARIKAVAQSQDVRQKKREENLQKRKEGKGVKGKKPAKKPKAKARPGFEGSFRAGGARK